MKFLGEMESLAGESGGLYPPLYAIPDEARALNDGLTSWHDKYHQSAMKAFGRAAIAAGPSGVHSLLRRFAQAARRMPGGNKLLSSRMVRAVRALVEPGHSSSETPEARASDSGVLRNSGGREARASADLQTASDSPSPADLRPLADPRTLPDSPTPWRVSASHPWAGIQRHTAFEKLLYTWGFIAVVKLVEKRRVAAERYLRTLEPDMYRAGSEVHLPRTGQPDDSQ
jgi:hypothetical protein